MTIANLKSLLDCYPDTLDVQLIRASFSRHGADTQAPIDGDEAGHFATPTVLYLTLGDENRLDEAAGEGLGLAGYTED